MPGTWLAQLGQRCLHGDTFVLVVSPAIADMQFESPGRFLLRARHYVAIAKAFAGALYCDAAADVQSLRDDLPSIAGLTLLQSSYYAFLLLLLSGLGSGKLAAHHPDETTALHVAGCVAAVALLCLIPTAACFWPPRRGHHVEPAQAM
jgi:hypothetical protein